MLRGLRTLSLRMAQHQASALQIAHWLEAQPEVAQVLHPALPGAPVNSIARSQLIDGGANPSR